MWPTRQLRDHGVAVLRIRSSGAQSSEEVQIWIQLLEVSG
jgi:Holliday junction resolvase